SKHHRTAKGVWLVSYKKSSGKARLDYEAVCEELVCFGWVDSRPAKLDAERSMLLCTPRKPKSAWSKPNKDRVAKMTAAGKMAQAGLDAVSVARQNGRWSALDAVERLEVPADLARALAAHDGAQGHFDAFPRSAKRGILEWIAQAKKPLTRSGRIAETARLAARNLRANQWPRATSSVEIKKARGS
ncbi:MAG: YdeI/OmpD-associated family protein, partial [Myxococcaceae bacterium]|nr:YdeI/OmpD-associated family protein [Myxococcaceae bacterium]